MHSGKGIIFSAPSGAGKTSIVRALLSQIEELEFSVSACSRAMRPGEINGVDYHFLSPDEFREKINQGAFLEWEEVYPGSFYGTLASEVERIWDRGKTVIFDVDVAGGLQIKQKLGNQALSVFVMPPSLEVLRERLTGRGTENKESLSRRLGKAAQELSFAGEFDLRLVNDNLSEAIERARKLCESFIGSGSLPERTGLLFGSFNPPHCGHMIIAQYFLQFTDLKEIWMVLSPQNPLKQAGELLDAEKRMQLLKEAIAQNDNILVCDEEIRAGLPGPSYTADTLQRLQKAHPERDFVLLIGSDNLAVFDQWKDYSRIASMLDIYVYPRPGYTEVRTQDYPRMKIVDAPLISLSSSMIRMAIRQGRDMRYFMPEGVYRLIVENGYFRY